MAAVGLREGETAVRTAAAEVAEGVSLGVPSVPPAVLAAEPETPRRLGPTAITSLLATIAVTDRPPGPRPVVSTTLIAVQRTARPQMVHTVAETPMKPERVVTTAAVLPQPSTAPAVLLQGRTCPLSGIPTDAARTESGATSRVEATDAGVLSLTTRPRRRTAVPPSPELEPLEPLGATVIAAATQLPRLRSPQTQLVTAGGAPGSS